jgi:hypothetical protein
MGDGGGKRRDTSLGHRSQIMEGLVLEYGVAWVFWVGRTMER